MLNKGARQEPFYWNLPDQAQSQQVEGSIAVQQSLSPAAFTKARGVAAKTRRNARRVELNADRPITAQIPDPEAAANPILGLAQRIAAQSSITTQVLLRRAARGGLMSRMKRVLNAAVAENWDGYGAHPVSTNAVEHAERFVILLPATVPDPDPSVDTDGAMAFEWYRGPRRVFSVSVTGDGAQIGRASCRERV